MKTKEIKTLLRKYYDGSSTPEEERLLEQYFLNGDPEPGFETDRMQFLAMSGLRDEEIVIPVDLEAGILEKLESLQKPSVRPNIKLVYRILSVAAAVVLLVSTFIFLRTNNDNTITISDPQLAYAETEQALETVSLFLNKGTAPLGNLAIMNKAIKPLSGLNEIENVTRDLSILDRLDKALKATGQISKGK